MADFSDEQKKFVDSTVEYLESNEVYDLFDSMTQELLLHQPENPIQFLIEHLSKKPTPKIILLSPPGACDIKQVATKTSAHFGVPVIQATNDVDSLLTKLKNANSTGYVLTGFPSSRVDTLKMLIQKVIPDKIVLLRVSEEVLLNRVSLAGPGQEMGEDERNIRQFFRHIVGVLQLVGPQTFQVDVQSLQTDEIVKAITARVALKAHSATPFRPHRVTLSGPPASGRSEIARDLADIFGSVHIDVAALLRDTASKTPTLPISQAIQNSISTGEMLADDLVCQLVEERLRHADCQSRGWVLDGFPVNEVQAKHLRASRLLPSRAVVFTAAAETVRSNIESRLTDPVTGAVYNHVSAQTLEPTVRARLVASVADVNKDVVERRVANVSNTAQAVAAVFPKIADIIPLGGEYKQTLDRVRDFVERPLAEEH